MCTVIFMPGDNGPTFASCRDENPARPAALIPAIKNGDSGQLIYPEDGAATGTWIGLHERGDVIILLNGAFEKHERREAYAMSRGLIVKELLDAFNPLKCWHLLDLEHIEPFTLVGWLDGQLYELVWDSTSKFETPCRVDVPAIWSSVTLYDAAARHERQRIFAQCHNNSKTSIAAYIMQFLKSYNDPYNGFVMKRNTQVQTLSISIIDRTTNGQSFLYEDLVTNTTHVVSLPLNQHH